MSVIFKNYLAAENFPIAMRQCFADRIDLSIWRYSPSIPIHPLPEKSVLQAYSLGEGRTPLVSRSLGKDRSLLLKLDYLLPTGSFKDRGACLMVLSQKMKGTRHVVCDSSGNLGSSVAAYASSAGLKCTVFMPSSNSVIKKKMIEAYGADVYSIDGDRAAATKAAIDYSKSKNYLEYLRTPEDIFFPHGVKTFIFEVYEQLGNRLPNTILLPLGHGTMLIGAYQGICDLKSAGLITEMPKLIGVQTEFCAPIYEHFYHMRVNGAKERGLAEGIAITDPPKKDVVVNLIKQTDGMIRLVSDKVLEQAVKKLARSGFFVEPTAAVCFAALEEWIADDIDSAPLGETLILLCGSGMKSLI